MNPVRGIRRAADKEGVLGHRRPGFAPIERAETTRLDIDPIAKTIASAMLVLPLSLRVLILVAVLSIALSGLALLIIDPDGAPAAHVAIGNILASGATFAFLLLPCHELAHAVMCRAVGVATGGLGVRWRRFRLPSFYIDTTNLYAVSSRTGRFSVPAAGPLVDITLCGGFAWLAFFFANTPLAEHLLQFDRSPVSCCVLLQHQSAHPQRR